MFLSENYSSKIQIVSASNSDRNFAKLLNQAQKYTQEIWRKNLVCDAQTIKNYEENSLSLHQQKIISLAFYQNKVFAFAGAKTDSEFYPENSIRVLNRFYIEAQTRLQIPKDPANDFRGLPRKPVVSLIMAEQQAKIAKALGFTFAFISREALNFRWLKKYSHELNEFSNFSWQHREDLAGVCFLESSRCWQHIIATDLGLQNRDMQPKHCMSTKNFKDKFKSNPKERC